VAEAICMLSFNGENGVKIMLYFFSSPLGCLSATGMFTQILSWMCPRKLNQSRVRSLRV